MNSETCVSAVLTERVQVRTQTVEFLDRDGVLVAVILCHRHQVPEAR